MQGIREFLNTPAGKGIGAIIGLVVVGLAVWIVVGQFRGSTAERDSRQRMFIDAETGGTFRHSTSWGETIPVRSPHSGRDTGFPAEACYWDADGTARQNPTYVLVAERAGQSGPTFCPDCDRLVVTHNPTPSEGVNPPPTRQDFERRGQQALPPELTDRQ